MTSTIVEIFTEPHMPSLAWPSETVCISSSSIRIIYSRKKCWSFRFCLWKCISGLILYFISFTVNSYLWSMVNEFLTVSIAVIIYFHNKWNSKLHPFILQVVWKKKIFFNLYHFLLKLMVWKLMKLKVKLNKNYWKSLNDVKRFELHLHLIIHNCCYYNAFKLELLSCCFQLIYWPRPCIFDFYVNFQVTLYISYKCLQIGTVFTLPAVQIIGCTTVMSIYAASSTTLETMTKNGILNPRIPMICKVVLSLWKRRTRGIKLKSYLRFSHCTPVY